MSLERLVTTHHLAALESAVVVTSRALVATYPDASRECGGDEPIEVAIARSLVKDCEHLLAALDDYRSHLVSKPPESPEQLDLPF